MEYLHLYLLFGGILIGMPCAPFWARRVVPKWAKVGTITAIILIIVAIMLWPGHLQSDPPTPEQRIGTGKLVLAGAGGPAIAILLILGMLYILMSTDIGQRIFVMAGLAYVAYAIIIQITGLVPEGERWRPDQIRDGLIAVSLVGGIAHCIYLSSRRKGPPGPPPPFF